MKTEDNKNQEKWSTQNTRRKISDFKKHLGEIVFEGLDEFNASVLIV
jgi:hypothetical protein